MLHCIPPGETTSITPIAKLFMETNWQLGVNGCCDSAVRAHYAMEKEK